MLLLSLLSLLLVSSTVVDAAPQRNETSSQYFIDLFHQLDPRLPRGYYRIPSLISSTNGTLLAFIAGRMHRTDSTPNIIYLRRSFDDGNTWEPAQTVLSDPRNGTEYGGVPIVDTNTGVIHFLHNAAIFGDRQCTACFQRTMSSSDHGATWTPSVPANTTGKANTTYGGGLASGITLKKGPHAGRLVAALRHDCGCGDLRSSFAIYSDDHGATWTGGQQMILLPQYGGGWTEDQVAELSNGSVLMTSRNLFGLSSGQGPRLFARSDDGGATWAANWSAYDLTDPYCEASLLSNVSDGTVYFGNPSNHGRGNFSVHSSSDGGRTWPKSVIVYPGGSEYSDMTFLRNGSIGIFFEKDGYNTASFTVVSPP